MSTRATYQFVANPDRLLPAITFYIHHDGYLEGAAAYFKAAMLNWTGGGLPERFLRANDRAEFARDHQAHGDTEYRYTVDGTFLRAEKRYNWTEVFNGIFVGDLVEFVEKYGETKLLKWHDQYFDLELARGQLKVKLAEAKRQTESGWTGNASSAMNEVWRFSMAMFKTFGPDEATEQASAEVQAADRIHCVAYGWPEQFKCTEEEAYVLWTQRFRIEDQSGGGA